jgi:hypothetical protein
MSLIQELDWIDRFEAGLDLPTIDQPIIEPIEFDEYDEDGKPL